MEIGEFVEQLFGTVLTGRKKSASESGMVAGPAVDGAAVDSARLCGGGDGQPCGEGFEDSRLDRSESVEKCRICGGGHGLASIPV